jgi:hypothetical protein
MAESSWHLGVYSWSSCYVRRWWNGFHTRVHIVRCAWVSVATPPRSRRLRPPFLDTRSGNAYPLWVAPGHPWPQARIYALSQRERWEEQIGGKIPCARANRRLEKWWCGSFPGLVLFRLVLPHLQSGVVGPFHGMGCMVPQSFAIGGNRSYLEFWAVTGGPRYLGYITLIVALGPSVERVAGASHLMVGRTCTHMVLWVLPWDSAVRLRG